MDNRDFAERSNLKEVKSKKGHLIPDQSEDKNRL